MLILISVLNLFNLGCNWLAVELVSTFELKLHTRLVCYLSSLLLAQLAIIRSLLDRALFSHILSNRFRSHLLL